MKHRYVGLGARLVFDDVTINVLISPSVHRMQYTLYLSVMVYIHSILLHYCDFFIYSFLITILSIITMAGM